MLVCTALLLGPSPAYSENRRLNRNIVIPESAQVAELSRRFARSAVLCVAEGDRRYLITERTRRGRLNRERLRLTSATNDRKRALFRSLRRECRSYNFPPNIPDNEPSPTPSCEISLEGAQIETLENRDVELPLRAVSTCQGVGIEYHLVEAPSRGSVDTPSIAPFYRGTFFEGEDRFALKACLLGHGAVCSSPAEFRIVQRAGIFTGRRYSLAPYKDQISELEIRYLLDKVAYGGCEDLVRLGAEEGLAALVDALVDDPHGGCRYELPIIPGGYNPGESRPDNTDPDAFAYWMAHPRHWGHSIEHWTRTLLYRQIVLNLRYGAPLREYLWSTVWAPYFATNLFDPIADGSIHSAKLHYNMLSTNALGHFDDFFRQLYGPLDLPNTPAEARVPGVDPLLPYNPDKTSPDGIEIYSSSGPYPAYGGIIFQRGLNNETNAHQRSGFPTQRLNENLGRESLQRHTVGEFTLRGGQIFTEADVRASTMALTGYGLDYDGNANADGNVNTRYTARNADAAGPWRFWMSFFPIRSSAAQGVPVTLFADTPHHYSGLLTADFGNTIPGARNIFDVLLNDHPATSMRLAARLYSHLVGPHLLDDVEKGEEVVMELAAQLLTYAPSPQGMRNYDIARTVKRILRSEAMFSDRVHGIASPLEVIVETLRMSDITVRRQDIPDVVAATLRSAGDDPLEQPNPFGVPSFGNDGARVFHDGSYWLNASALHGLSRAVMRILNDIFVPLAGPPSMPKILFPRGDEGCNPNDFSLCPSAAEVVDYMLRKFNLNGVDRDGRPIVSLEEREILISFVDRPNAPWPQSNLGLQGHTEVGGIVMRRGIGLIYLLATHVARLRK